VANPGDVPMMERDAFVAVADPVRERADG
jgi:hypothetical protein